MNKLKRAKEEQQQQQQSSLNMFIVSHTDIDECASQPCKNYATCTDRVNGYSCSCAPGFYGTQCELELGMPCGKGLC